jgi:hypothetical protein
MNLVTPKAGAKHEVLLNEPASKGERRKGAPLGSMFSGTYIIGW